MRLGTHVVRAVAVLFLVSCKKERVEPPPPPAWHELASGEALARRQHRPALVFLGASWSKADVELERYVFPDPEVRNALRDWVLIKVDMTDDEDKSVQAAASRFDTVGVPTTLGIDFGEPQTDPARRPKELFRFNEFVKPPVMAAKIREANLTIARRRAAAR